MRVTFEQITRKKAVMIPCRVCKRRMRRVLSVMNTVNPFNKDEHGVTKSRIRVTEDVSAALSDLVDKSMAEGIVCAGCHEEVVYNGILR